METPSDRTESEQEQLNRQLGELLQELRVAMPGVQVLFGFLLAAAFNQRFGEVTRFQLDVYVGTLCCAALATAFFIAPTAYHRILFRHRDKRHLIRVSTRMTVLGLVFLALAMTGAVLLVTDFLFGTTTTLIATGFIAAFLALFWYVLPLSRRAAT